MFFLHFQTETMLFADALNVVSQAIEDLAIEEEIITEPLDCENNRKFRMGNLIVEQVKKVRN